MGVYRVNTKILDNHERACWELSSVIGHLIAWDVPLKDLVLSVRNGQFNIETPAGLEANETRQAHLNITRIS